MKIPKITFIEFLQLPETERIELQTIIANANEFDKRFEVDCQEWTMGQVKDARELINRQKTYEDIIKLVEIERESAISLDVNEFLGLYNSIVKGINEITEIESKTLGHDPTPNEAIASEEVGGFSVFASMPQIDQLAKGNLLDYERIRALKWSDCFNKLVYDKRQNDFQSKLIELNSHSND